MRNAKKNYMIGAVLIVAAFLFIYIFVKPLMMADFRGQQVPVYSMSALVLSFSLKCLAVVGLYFILRGLMVTYPSTLGSGKMLNKICIIFLILLIFLNIMELALQGIFSQEVLKDRVENYENPLQEGSNFN